MLPETFVYNRLRKYFGTDIYYSKENTEVDFYIPDREPIQVTFSMDNYQTREREIKALGKAIKS
ncbi:MAG TPA: hypothetical protein ENH02_04505 [Bacteroidetes bacterium]|nr:hypothetical protein [Bacteroidota bacterium]